ncbi:MAG: ABC transporter ATP-binding protein [bacterium]|nr:ABC transporter ATP-binding protein [bacterium]
MPSSWKRFFYTYKQITLLAYRVSPSLLVFVTVVNSLWGLTNLPILYVNKLLIDVVIASLGKPDWTIYFKPIAILILVRSLIELVRSVVSRYSWRLGNNLTRRIAAHMDVMLGEKLNSLDIPTLESPDFQDKYKKVERESNQRVWGMISSLSEVPNAVFTIISAIIPILDFNPLIGLAVVLVRIPEAIINAKLAKQEYQKIEARSFQHRLWGWINFHLTNSKHYYENKILGNSAHLAGKMQAIQKELLDEDFHMSMKRANYRSVFADIPESILSFGLNLYFFVQAIMGRITLGLAQMLYQASSTLGAGFGQLFNNVSLVYENYLFVNDFTWFMDLEPKNAAGKIVPAKKFKAGIDFENVWFKYANSPDWILRGVNFHINPEENIAMVGENGAGKTTTIKILCGFYPPTKGRVLVNGVDIREYSPTEYVKSLGVLFQDFGEYPFTAGESIGYGDVSRLGAQTEIKAAAEQTDIHEFIQSLPLKYDNPLTKEFAKGIDPSKGQWQRIALARTLFRKSQIIILDEPTSNVDPKAEEEIFEKIIKLTQKQILILISHRFSTVRRADKILLLETGKIRESGTHEQLMKKKGKYAQLFNLQAKSYH